MTRFSAVGTAKAITHFAVLFLLAAACFDYILTHQHFDKIFLTNIINFEIFYAVMNPYGAYATIFVYCLAVATSKNAFKFNTYFLTFCFIAQLYYNNGELRVYYNYITALTFLITVFTCMISSLAISMICRILRH